MVWWNMVVAIIVLILLIIYAIFGLWWVATNNNDGPIGPTGPTGPTGCTGTGYTGPINILDLDMLIDDLQSGRDIAQILNLNIEPQETEKDRRREYIRTRRRKRDGS